MTVRRVMPILTVSDLEASRDAYVRILGLREVMNHGWIVTLADDELRHQVSLMTKDATAPVNPSVSIEVDDVDAAYQGRGRCRVADRPSAQRRGMGRSTVLLRRPVRQRRQRVEPLARVEASHKECRLRGRIKR